MNFVFFLYGPPKVGCHWSGWATNFQNLIISLLVVHVASQDLERFYHANPWTLQSTDSIEILLLKFSYNVDLIYCILEPNHQY